MRQGLEALARPKLEVTLHGGTPADLTRLANDQLSLLREELGPVLAGVALGGNNGHDQRLAEVAKAIANTQRVIERGMARPERIDVSLDAHTRSNFFRPVSSEDVCSLGGLFVATYERPPALDAPIELALVFPTGPTCSVFGSVTDCAAILDVGSRTSIFACKGGSGEWTSPFAIPCLNNRVRPASTRARRFHC
jgi:hypothetical protein